MPLFLEGLHPVNQFLRELEVRVPQKNQKESLHNNKIYIKGLKRIGNGPEEQQHRQALPIVENLDVLVPAYRWQQKAQTQVGEGVETDEIERECEDEEDEDYFRGTDHAGLLGLYLGEVLDL